MKKTISMILASVMVASSASTVFAKSTFSDVLETGKYSWAYPYVEDMAERGLIAGYEDNTYRPEKSVSRMEAFSLFARMMGSTNEENEASVAAAVDEYSSVLKKYNLSYAEKEVAYMMYRGVLEEDELDQYFAGNKKSEPMPRYEAAVLITKSMLMESEARSEVLVDLDYTDVAKIPKDVKQYVYFVSKNGIMSGMGDGTFSPDTSVERGQVAVMLSRTLDIVGYSFETATIVSVNSDKNQIKAKDIEGKDFVLPYTEISRFYLDGELVIPTKLSAGQEVIFTYANDGSKSILAFADAKSVEVKETKKVVFKSYTSKGGALYLTCIDPATEDMDIYPLSDSVKVTADGVGTDINKLTSGEYVTIGLSDDTVVTIDAMRKSAIIDAKIESISSNGAIKISSTEEEFNGMILTLSSDVDIRKNGEMISTAELYRGDSAKVTLTYGVVTKIVASSAVKTVSGVVTGYSISTSGSTISINKDGTDYTFDIPAGVTITNNGTDAKLTDFAIGSSVTLTVESDAVKKIAASTNEGSLTNEEITGTVVGVYDKTISIINDQNGGSIQIPISCTSATKIYAIPSLAEYSLKKIKAGDVITAYGGYKGGIFVSTGIMVTPSGN